MKNKIKKIIREIIIFIFLLRNRIFKQFFSKKYEDINIMLIIGKIANGGAERACVNLAEELHKKYNVIIVVFNETQNEYECNVPIIKLNNKKSSNLKRIFEISKIKKERNITHTISFLTSPNYINVTTSRYDKSIISIRNYMTDLYNGRKKDIYLHKISCLFADKIVSVSKDVEEDQLQNWKIKKEKSITITNFVDEKKIIKNIQYGKIDKENENIFKNSQVVINVGRLVKQKGQAALIRAFKEVVQEIPKAKLIILGEGELKEHLSNLITELHLEKHVFLLGFKSNPYIYMSKSKLFVSNSYFEGMSNVILEAMKCNLPVIATNGNGGNKELLLNNNKQYGILVPVCKNSKDEKVLASEIIKMLKNENLRQEYINKSKERIKDYSKENIIKQWEVLLKE